MTKTKSTKRFLAIILTLVCTITLCQSFSTKVSAAGGTNGWGLVRTDANVYNASGYKIGTLFANEGFTILSRNGKRYYVEYSTSNGAKRGYINCSAMQSMHIDDACSATVKTSCNTYYAASTNLKAGSLSKGETVAVLCSNGVYDYVEYNVSGGKRKRAYVEKRFLNYSFNNLPPMYQDNKSFAHSSYTVPAKQTVYGGPSMKYATIGEVYAKENVTIIRSFPAVGYKMYYIRYTASGHNKYGYIKAN